MENELGGVPPVGRVIPTNTGIARPTNLYPDPWTTTRCYPDPWKTTRLLEASKRHFKGPSKGLSKRLLKGLYKDFRSPVNASKRVFKGLLKSLSRPLKGFLKASKRPISL